MWAATLQSTGWLPQVSPYDLPVDGLGEFRELLTRRVDFDAFTPDPGGPLLVVGAVDVLSGRFRAFHSYHEPITPDMI
jgi:NTE family protein